MENWYLFTCPWSKDSLSNCYVLVIVLGKWDCSNAKGQTFVWFTNIYFRGSRRSFLAQGVMIWWCECNRRERSYNPGSRGVFLHKVTSFLGIFRLKRCRGMKNGVSRRKCMLKAQKQRDLGRQWVGNIYSMDRAQVWGNDLRKWGSRGKPGLNHKG